MSLTSILFKIGAGKSDRKRDAQIPFPEGVKEWNDISYGPHGKANLLDVYRPINAGKCPIIVNVHGGGYVYGDKELYKRYCMDLARRGFAVVNFNYRMAPRWKFPAPLEDLNNVMHWVATEGQWFGDTEKVFMLGDSAGAQLTSQYAAMLHNLEYMSHFRFPHPGIFLKAIGLNCGMYDMASQAAEKRTGITLDYLGKHIPANDPRFRVLEAINSNYPPAHITTACHDFLRPAAQPMFDLLTQKGIPCRLDVYGTEEDSSIGHVFHINIITQEAIRCNDAQCDFFRQYL